MNQTDIKAYRKQLWPMPPVTRTEDGAMRRLGVEIEFAGLDIEQIVELLIQSLGGQANKISDYEYALEGAHLADEEVGTFGIELDYAYLKRLGKEREQSDEKGELGELTEGLLSLLAKQVVPFEIVCPPLDMHQLWHLEDVIRELRHAGAKGTNHATAYAFGLQLNPEMPNMKAETILAYIRAFQCLFLWLRERSQVDLSRRFTPYIDPCGKDYLKLIMDDDYAPDLTTLMDDYLEHNPTRNRAMDMMPLFTHLDEPRVRAAVDDDRIKPRPTLHYRLPNCQIDEPDWALIRPWRDWLQVESLACDEQRLKTVCRGYRKYLKNPVTATFSDWGEASMRWLLPELL